MNPGRVESRPSGDGELCPACRTERFEPIFPARAFEIARCRTCGLVRTLGVTIDGGMDYPPFDQRDTPLVRLLRTAVGQLVRERLGFVRRVRSSGRLLDFGCGSGSFARLACSAGYDVVGLEPFSLGQPLESPRLRLVRGSLDQHADTLGKFDVITLWQVLEHVRDPRALLERLLTHLAPGGALVISVPNFGSWQSRAFGPSWFHLDPPRHITHFERRTILALFAQLGLEPIAEQRFHLEYGPVGWLQSSLNRLLPRPNFLYEFVKDRGALDGVSPALVAFNLVGSLVSSLLLALPALAVETAAAQVQAGAVLTFAVEPRPAG